MTGVKPTLVALAAVSSAQLGQIATQDTLPDVPDVNEDVFIPPSYPPPSLVAEISKSGQPPTQWLSDEQVREKISLVQEPLRQRIETRQTAKALFEEGKLTQANVLSMVAKVVREEPPEVQQALVDLWRGYEKLIWKMAHKLARKHDVSPEELVEEAMIGFMEKVIPKFEPERGNKLSTFLGTCLYRYMEKYAIRAAALSQSLDEPSGKEDSRPAHHKLRTDGPTPEEEVLANLDLKNLPFYLAAIPPPCTKKSCNCILE